MLMRFNAKNHNQRRKRLPEKNLKSFKIIVYLLLSYLSPPLSAITLTEFQRLDFGMIANLNGLCELDVNNRLRGVCVGIGQVGIIEISGVPKSWVNVMTSGPETVQPGLIFTPILQKDRIRLDNFGRGQIEIGGSLQLQNTQGGQVNMNYYISVIYE